MLTLEALQNVGTKKSRKSKNGARVTSKVIAAVEAKGAGSAQISVAGAPLEKAGTVSLKLGRKTFSFVKVAKQNVISPKNVENKEDFLEVFNKLCKEPDKLQGEVSFVELEA